MKKLLLIILSVYSIIVNAQQFNNEWIDYGKTYYKFKIGATGLYRISQSQLSGIGLSATDVSHFQFWRNGKEIPVYTSVQSGVLPSSGYIEFWGEMNDGKSDQVLYRQADFQISDTKSLFTDTSAYFLTINSSSLNKRFIPTANTIPANATPEPYFMYKTGEYFNEEIHLGAPYGSTASEAVYPASYESGEGWASADIATGATKSFTKNNLFVYSGTGSPDAEIKMNAVGNAGNEHKLQLSLNGDLIFDASIIYYNYIKLSKTIASSKIATGTANFSITNATSAANDRVRVAFVEMNYPRSFNFGGASNFRFQLPAKSIGTYLEISGFSFSGIPVIYDLSNGKRYEVDATNPSLLKVFLQSTSVDQDLVLVNEDASNIKSMRSFETRNFENYVASPNQGNYLIITNKLLLSGSNGSQPVEDYRAFRSTVAGGSFNSKIYLIDQLIDQFGFGIKQDPLAIRNFIRYARNKFSSPVQHVFIIGKGVNYYLARLYEPLPETEKLNLVPTFGSPGSDILLSAEGSSSIPLTPIGRLSVVNGDELKLYLDKVKQYEQQSATLSPLVDESSWKKDVIHMVGSNSQAEINRFYGFLNGHKEIIKDTFYGANVVDFLKDLSNSVQQLTTERLTAVMNNGVGLLSYFGHASATTLGFNLDLPENYSNQNKYPIFNMMGCDVGNIFGFQASRLNIPQTISEKYLLAKERGSIAMMAGTSLGYDVSLNEYNIRFYNYLTSLQYGSDLGVLMQSTIKKVFRDIPEESSLLYRIQCELFTLHGDPAINFYHFAKPDYAIESKLVKITPSFISIADKEFSVDCKIYNLGCAVKNKVIVEVKRTYADLSYEVLRKDTISSLYYADSLHYSFPINPLKDKGMNKITITIDPLNQIDELFENNNTVTKDVFIYEDDLKPIYPYDLSIVNKQGITFSSSTANPLASSKTYLIEIDTTKLFNSSLKITQTKVSSGGIIEFNPTIVFKDSTVYYWRVAAMPSGSEQPNWNTASFTYINGLKNGYNQSHYYQFLDNSYSNIEISADRKLKFTDQNVALNITTAIYPFGTQAQSYQLLINDIPVALSWVSPFETQINSLRFYVIDNKSMKLMLNKDLGSSGLYGSYRPIPYYPFAKTDFFQFDISTTAARKTVMNFLDSIPDNYYVIATNSIYYSTILPAVWQSDTTVLGHNQSLYHKFLQMGASKIGDVTSFVPFIFIIQKNNATALVQKIATDPSELLNITTIVKASGSQGSIQTQPIGIASAWKKIYWNGYSIKVPVSDPPLMDVIGLKNDGSQATLFTNIQLTSQPVDISSIDAKVYPKLKIVVNTKDTINYQPFQLRSLLVDYTPVPEGALAPNIYFSKKDTLEIGEPFTFGVVFKNVSDYAFDSLKVKLSIWDKNNVENIIPIPNQKPLQTKDTIKLNVPINTKSFAGNNVIFLEFNPDSHQPEQFHFNNFFYNNFYVSRDTTNPFMDVTFDGAHILNKDIVSSRPQILIKLTDDSKWMLLNNSDLVKVQLKYPSGNIRTFTYNSDTLKFNAPGSGTNSSNTATISFAPYLNVDGNYELIISAKDQSGNSAGDLQYRVAFQVINKPMISNLLNYPNPFTTSTAFVFTLTGSEVPQNIRIQILTITGKIVKEITKAELGNIKIGRNITEYKWDGTDQYGQKLANGVYLYRVITNMNGKSLEKYKSETDNTDKYFNKGYGKMYLMR